MKFRKNIFLFIVLLVSCKDQKSDILINKNFNNSSMIENILEKHLKQGANQYIVEAGVEIPKKEFDDLELDAVNVICKNKLISNGYKTISQEEFGNRINKIFGRTIDFSSKKNYLYINNFDKCDKIFNKYPPNDVDYSGTYIVKKEKFITNFYFIPELIDYAKDFLEISKIENNILTSYTEGDNNFSIELWKDIEDLPEQRYKNIQILVNRNKYLFNDNKASFAWLKLNDIDFLESLVKTFGYVADKDLLKFVLDKNLSNNDEFGKVFWTKDCDNKIKFHKETLDIIENLSKDKQEKYFEKIVDYFDYLLIDKLNQEAGEVDLTFSQKTEMLGKLAYYATKATGNQGDYYYRFFKFLNYKDYFKEFEKHNYYNIKDFKEIFEETKTGGVGLPM